MATRERTTDRRAGSAEPETGRDLHRRPDENPDPITGAPGAHPVGSGVGAAGGTAAGAAAGAFAGPVGIVAGGIVGGLLGGLAGKGVAEYIDPTEEHNYWRDQYATREYADGSRDYEIYAPAYQYGWESYSAYGIGDEPRPFEEVESDLQAQWNKHRSENDLTWDEARPATRDAWNRIHERHPKKTS